MIEEYINQVDKFTSIRPETVLEIGALDGVYARTLQKFFGLQEKDLYLVEPNPDLCDELARHFPAANRYNLAVTDGRHAHGKFNQVTAHSRDARGCSSLLERMDGWKFDLVHKEIEVATVSGSTLLKTINRPVDLCIVDVEGMSYQVLESFGEDIRSIRSLMVECEHDEIFKGQKFYADVCRLLQANGFKQMAFRYAYPYQSDSIWIQEKFLVWFHY